MGAFLLSAKFDILPCFGMILFCEKNMKKMNALFLLTLLISSSVLAETFDRGGISGSTSSSAPEFLKGNTNPGAVLVNPFTNTSIDGRGKTGSHTISEMDYSHTNTASHQSVATPNNSSQSFTLK